MDENLRKAAKLAQWLIDCKGRKRNVAELIASRKYKVARQAISPARQLLRPKQQTFL